MKIWLRTLLSVTAAVLVMQALLPTSAIAAPRCFGKKATIVVTGKDGGKATKGTRRRDVIVVKAGGSRVYAKGGNDLICGGKGSDWIDGGTGNDRISAGAGLRDILQDPAGNNVLMGGEGTDWFIPEGGNDVIDGGDSNIYWDDAVFFDDGPHPIQDPLATTGVAMDASGAATGHGTDHLSRIDYIAGTPFGDVLWGNELENTLEPLGGPDVAHGAGAHDSITGGGSESDTDEMYGDEGDDYLSGGGGTDTANGGPGTDNCIAETKVECEYSA